METLLFNATSLLTVRDGRSYPKAEEVVMVRMVETEMTAIMAEMQ